LSSSLIRSGVQGGSQTRSTLRASTFRLIGTLRGSSSWPVTGSGIRAQPSCRIDIMRSGHSTTQTVRYWRMLRVSDTADDENRKTCWPIPVGGPMRQMTCCSSLTWLKLLVDLFSKLFGQTEILKLLPPDQVRATRVKISAKFERQSSGLTPVERLLKWSVSDPRRRTISPFSKVTVPEWTENRIKEGTLESLRAAIQMDPAYSRLIAHFGGGARQSSCPRKNRSRQCPTSAGRS
jgi:hypothetical protein